MVILEEIDDDTESEDEPLNRSREKLESKILEILDDTGNDDGNDNDNDDDDYDGSDTQDRNINEEDDNSHDENELKAQAELIMKTAESDSEKLLPEALETLLIDIIKPLFSKTQHPQLTSTGRKKLVADAPTLGRFNYDAIFDRTKPRWKNRWTSPLLLTITKRYNEIRDILRRRVAIETTFHLLVPPVLHLIDDAEISYKIVGCEILAELCGVIISCRSGIIKRTGLMDVFIEALRNTFTYLPSLTPEDESLKLMRAVYPAYLALVDARFIELTQSRYFEEQSATDNEAGNNKKKEGKHDRNTQIPSRSLMNFKIEEISSSDATTTTTPSTTKSHKSKANSGNSSSGISSNDSSKTQSKMTPAQISQETTLRQTYLTILLRHSLLYSLSHLSVGTTHGTSLTKSTPLSIFLLSQIPTLTTTMGIYTASHMQTILPILKTILLDPFAISSAPETSLKALSAMEAIIITCWPRIRDRWWNECIAALIGCWLNVIDDETGIKSSSFQTIKLQLRKVTMLIRDVVEETQFEELATRLIVEEEDLQGLFEPLSKSDVETVMGMM